MPNSNIVATKLGQSRIYNQLRAKSEQEGDAVQASVVGLVNNAGEYCYHKLKTVVRHMPEFTLHDEVHIFNVLSLMERLIPPKTLDFLSVPELMLLILTAFFHDIGMAAEEKQVRAWKRDWTNGGDDFEQQEYEKFNRYCQSFPSKLAEVRRLHDTNKHEQAQLLEEYLISEYIRETHSERARSIIATEWQSKITYKNTDITSEFAQLCFSHNQDASVLLNMTTTVLCDDHEYVCLPFIGVILRLADLLDFDPKRTPSVLFSHLSVRNPISLTEWKKHRAINSWSISPSGIIYSARCGHPAIEAAIRGFCEYIDTELRNCSHVLAHISDNLIESDLEYYRIPLPASVDRSRIGSVQDISSGKPLYIYRNTQFALSRNQVIDLLMGTKLYGNTEVALRELLQNSIDACLVRLQMENAWQAEYTPHISVRYSTDEGMDFLEIEDNGIGMNQHIVDSYYSKVGSSFYKSREFFDLLAHIGKTYEPISRFGIGILSCFMVSDSIDVQTRRLNPDQELDAPINIVIEGYDSIFYIREGQRKRPGTLTRLQLRNDNPWKRMSHQEFINSVRKGVPNPPFNIEIQTDKEKITHNNSYFRQLTPESLKDRTWEQDVNIKEVSFDFADKHLGMQGRAIVGILQQHDEPVEVIEVLSKTAEVDGETYELSLSLKYDHNEIEKRSTSIDVTQDGGIDSSSHYSVMARSRSAFSIHGIAFPDGLFRNYLSTPRQAELKWPFPMLLVLDISAPTDLDLNSSRTEIINNSKWQDFQINLARLICKHLCETLPPDYAKSLFEIYEKKGDDLFKTGMCQALKSDAKGFRSLSLPPPFCAG